MIFSALYQLAIYIYVLGILVASVFNRKARLMVKGHLETYRILKKKIDKNSEYIWFHAASLGEFEQGRPLMERMRRQHPEYKILLTFFSPSGYEVRKNYNGADVVCYLPFDTAGNILSFFRLVQPKVLFLIKYEFWCNMLIACKHSGIPVYSISSIFRPEKIYFRWYGKPYARILRQYIEHFYVQDDFSADMLRSIGISKNVDVVGDTRFDRVLDVRKDAKELPIVEVFKNNGMVFVAGSSWAPDESLIIPYFNDHKEIKLILAPHVIDEEHLKAIESKLKRSSLRYTEVVEREKNGEDVKELLERTDCLIVNCFGLLSSIYRYGEIAYVGGGFGVGIHNVPEAAVYGVPVLIGPNNKGFREAQDLLRLGGCFEITDQAVFNACVDRLVTETKFRERRGAVGKRYIESNAGASDKIFDRVVL